MKNEPLPGMEREKIKELSDALDELRQHRRARMDYLKKEIVNGNKIIDAPPIWKSWIGRAWSSFVAYHKPEVTKVVELEREEDAENQKVVPRKP